jgi:hypothetical protein
MNFIRPNGTLGAICEDTLLGPSIAKREATWPRRKRVQMRPAGSFAGPPGGSTWRMRRSEAIPSSEVDVPKPTFEDMTVDILGIVRCLAWVESCDSRRKTLVSGKAAQPPGGGRNAREHDTSARIDREKSRSRPGIRGSSRRRAVSQGDFRAHGALERRRGGNGPKRTWDARSTCAPDQIETAAAPEPLDHMRCADGGCLWISILDPQAI